MIAGAVYVLSNLNTTYVSRDYNLRRACEAYADSIIATVQEETYYRDIYNQPFPSGTRRPPVAAFSPTKAVTTPAWYWWSGTDADISRGSVGGQSPQLHSHFLIQGSLASLFAIYNNVSVVRCAYGAYAPLTTNVPKPQDLQNLDVVSTPVTARMRLEPYNALTGASLCPTSGTPPSPLTAAPRGVSASSVADPERRVFDLGSGEYLNTDTTRVPSETVTRMNPSASARAIAQRTSGLGNVDLGMGMSVEVAYHYDGKDYTCAATQRFEYPADRTPPPVPDLAQVRTNTSINYNSSFGAQPYLRNYTCSGSLDPRANATIRLGYNSVAHEGGVQFMCKDLSAVRSYTNTVSCRSAASGTVLGSHPSLAQFASGAVPPSFASRQAFWQPCDLLGLCGVSPSGAALTLGTNQRYLDLQYTNLPPGCIMNFEVVAVDTAGNRSGSRTMSAGNKKFVTAVSSPTTTMYTNAGPAGDRNQNFAVSTDEIYYPTCGNRSTGDYYRKYAGYYCPAGYYSCNSSC